MSHKVPTDAKEPQAFVMNMTNKDPMTKGRLPKMFDPAAVKNVPRPVQSAERPIVQVLAVSVLMENCWDIMGIAGAIMTDMLMRG